MSEIVKTPDEKAIDFISNIGLLQTQALEDTLESEGLNEVGIINDMGLIDILCGNMYSRALTIYKGTFLTGKIHKKPYIDIFVSGDVTVKNFIEGEEESIERLTEFKFLQGIPGRKRVLYAHEDTLWITIDPTTAKTIDDAENEVAVYQMQDYYLNLIKENS